MKVDDNMKRKLLIVFIILFMFPMFVNAFDVDNYKYFYKKDEQGNYISNAEFIVRNLDGSIKQTVTYDSNYKAYRYDNFFEEDFDKSMKLLPTNIKNIINSFNNVDDVVPYINQVQSRGTISDFKEMEVLCEMHTSPSPPDVLKSDVLGTEYKAKKMVYSNVYNHCNIYVPIVMFVEETKTPKGFEKETSAIASFLFYEYDFDDESGNILDKKVSITLSGPSHYKDENNEEISLEDMYKYDDNLNYSNIENVYNTFLNYGLDMKYPKTTCNNAKSSPKVKKQSTIDNYSIKKLGGTEFTELSCTPIIVDKRGTSSLNISSYVNNEEEMALKETSTVTIKVFLKNDGKAPSYDNVVVSNVPKGVEYVEDSATDNGVYNEESKTVTWNLDYLDSEKGYTFTYDVIVPKGQSSSVYVTTSSVSAGDNETPIESNEARVTTPGTGNIVNPKTGDTRSSIIVVLLIISFSALYYSFTKKSLSI